MRILHITDALQNRTGSVLIELARRQRLQGHEPVVVTSTPLPGGRHPSRHVDGLRTAGVPVLTVDSLVRRRLDVSLHAAGAIRRQLGGLRGVDIIHTHATVPSTMALLVAAESEPSIPVVQTMYEWTDASSDEDHAADAAVLDLLTRVIVPTRQSADRLVSLGVAPERVRIVGHGVAPIADPLHAVDLDDDDFRELMHMRRNGQFVLGSIGPLGAAANQQLIIEALALLRPAERPVCVFIGDGPAAERAMLAEAWEVGQSVRFWADKPERRDFLRHTDGLLVPSADELLPVPVLEAYCDHVPVLAPAAPGLREVVHRDRCIAFESHNAEALALAVVVLRAMSRHDRAAMCARAHVCYRERFTAAAMTDTYMSVYAEMVAEWELATAPPFAA